QSQAGGHDFSEQARHFLVVQRPLVQLHDVLEHPGFTLGAVEHRLLAFGQRRGLDPRHFLGTTGTLADQVENPLVQTVDAYAQGLELVSLAHQPCSFSNSAMEATSAWTASRPTA